MRTILLAATLLAALSPASAAERLAGPFDAHVLRVIDGDTFVARIPVWLGLDVTVSVRLRGIDTAELRGPCPGQAQAARDLLSGLLATGPIRLTDITHDKYAGRVNAKVRLADGQDASEVIGAEKQCR
ncbi:MAG: hypothetical protein HQL42_16905 [Alphaproteobacteria bacterium]|nr:hypothetical protein [Alphaproteobacteria bacterium]